MTLQEMFDLQPGERVTWPKQGVDGVVLAVHDRFLAPGVGHRREIVFNFDDSATLPERVPVLPYYARRLEKIDPPTALQALQADVPKHVFDTLTWLNARHGALGAISMSPDRKQAIMNAWYHLRNEADHVTRNDGHYDSGYLEKIGRTIAWRWDYNHKVDNGS